MKHPYILTLLIFVSNFRQLVVSQRDIVTLPINSLRGKWTRSTTTATTVEEVASTEPAAIEATEPNGNDGNGEVTEVETTTVEGAPPGGCVHRWQAYDAINDPAAPSTNGIVFGNWQDDSTQYVAQATVDDGIDEYFPSYIVFEGSRPKGAYLTANDIETLANQSSVRFLVNNPEYTYKWVSMRPDEEIQNAVTVQNSFEDYLMSTFPVLRVRLTNGQGKSFTVTGVRSYEPPTTFYYNPIDKNYTNLALAPFEVLTCVTNGIEDNFRVTTPKYKRELCTHEWRRIDLKNLKDVADNGVLAGYYFDQSPIYIGRGRDECNTYGIGRVSINGSMPPGVYTLCEEKENRDAGLSAEFLVRNPSQTYSWVVNYNDEKVINSISVQTRNVLLLAARLAWRDRRGKNFTIIPTTMFEYGTWFYDPIRKINDEVNKEMVELLICTVDGSKEMIQEFEEGECIHTWRYFDHRDKPEAPAKEGIYVGNFFDDASIYVGKGWSMAYNVVPGRLTFNGTKDPGVWIYGNPVETVDDQPSAQYLVANPSHTYEWVKATPMNPPQNVVTVKNDGKRLGFSRLQITNGGNQFYVVGMTTLGLNTFFSNPVTRRLFRATRAVEFLVCTPNKAEGGDSKK